jgi:hypothetical protein
MAKSEVVPPRAAAMIHSMRAFGYSLPAAIADLVDNSISAHARKVDVDFHWAGASSAVRVVDDGDGMGEVELSEAMRLGSGGPLADRRPDDLGRFGLGLKTASFSQARSLTVASRVAGGSTATRTWDLDHVEATEEWSLLFDPLGDSSMQEGALDEHEHGTAVVWGKLDRLVGEVDADDAEAHQRFLAGVAQTERHLGMVFHRFLRGPQKLTIHVNGQELEGWDPFMEDQRATQLLPPTPLGLRGHMVHVTPFVLPHHSKLSSAEHTAGAGPHGWNEHQGFYVYRAERLLVAGDWLRLGFQKEEHFKLARIRIDLPNTLDADWQIDVRKATARPPGLMRPELKQIAKITRARASEVYRHRGKVIARESTKGPAFLWRQVNRRGKIIYAIQRDHPVIKALLDESSSFAEALRLIEETVPVPLIMINAAERPDELAAPFEGADDREVRTVMDRVRGVLLDHGMSDIEVRRQLAQMEPFNSFPEIIATLGDAA